MRTIPMVLLLLCTGAPLLLLGLAAAEPVELGGIFGRGETLYVQVVETDALGVVAGKVTLEKQGFFGLASGATTSPLSGWVAMVPEGQVPPASGERVTVTDDLAFTDPNGGTWLGREVSYGGGTAWVVPIGPMLYDETLGSEYNFAVVVDWTKVPAGGGLTTAYVPALELV